MRFAFGILLFLLFLPTSVLACACAGWRLPEDVRVAQAYDRAALVVVARVVRLRSRVDDNWIIETGDAEVLETFKSSGDLPSALPIRMQRSRDGFTSSCGEGAELHDGDYLLLYLNEPRVTEWSFDLCLRSKVASRRSDFDSEVTRLRALMGAR